MRPFNPLQIEVYLDPTEVRARSFAVAFGSTAFGVNQAQRFQRLHVGEHVLGIAVGSGRAVSSIFGHSRLVLIKVVQRINLSLFSPYIGPSICRRRTDPTRAASAARFFSLRCGLR